MHFRKDGHAEILRNITNLIDIIPESNHFTSFYSDSMSCEELQELYLHLTTWMKNLSVESNKLCGGPKEFKAAFLDQLIDCRSAVCQILSSEVRSGRKDILQTVVESLTSQIVHLEKLGNFLLPSS